MNEDKPITVSGSILLKIADRIAELDAAAHPFVVIARGMDTALNDEDDMTIVIKAGELRRLARATKKTEAEALATQRQTAHSTPPDATE